MACAALSNTTVCDWMRGPPPKKGVRTWVLDSEHNDVAFGLSADGWMVRAFKERRRNLVAKRKWVHPLGGEHIPCRAEYNVIVETKSCHEAAGSVTTIVGPGRACVDEKGWRSNGDLQLVATKDGFDMLTLDYLGEDLFRRGFFLAFVNATAVSRQRSIQGGRFVGKDERFWSPFLVDDRLYAHQWLYNHEQSTTLEIIDAEVVTAHTCTSASLWSTVRPGVDKSVARLSGGTNAVAVNATHHLAIGRSAAGRGYAMFAYTFESKPPFCIVAATHEFQLNPPPSCLQFYDEAGLQPRDAFRFDKDDGKSVQRPVALALDANRTALHLSWGVVSDRATYFSAVSLAWLLGKMRALRVQQHPRDKRGRMPAVDKAAFRDFWFGTDDRGALA